MPAEDAEQILEPWLNVSYEVDEGIGTRAHIGMLVYDVDQTLSHEARAMLTIPGIALYESRLPDGVPNEPLSIDNLAETDGIDEAVRLINTRHPSDVVAMGCTSAAMVIGTQELELRIRKVHPQARVTDPYTGILSALRSLDSSRVAFVSPYPREVAQRMIEGIEALGVTVPVVGTFHNESGVIRDDAPFISPASISKAVFQVINDADVDTVVIACTQMRAAAVIDDLEQQTGKTIVSSNQAMCWHALRLAGCDDSIPGWGRLFHTAL